MVKILNRSFKLWALNVLLVILSVIVLYLPFKIFRVWSKGKSTLFIAIPSSPDHSQQRNSLRETWLQLLQDKSYNYKFIIGSKMCKIHPLDRRSEYACEILNISLPKGVTEKTFFQVNSLKPIDRIVPIGLGFSFVVHHPVTIQSLGIREETLTKGSGQIMRVVFHFITLNEFVLYDPVTKLTSVTFYSDPAFETANSKSYVYKKLSNPVTLPKGFEGIIFVENVNRINEWDQNENCSHSTHWHDGNLFTILNVITTTGSFEVETDNFCILSSFGFTIKETTKLEQHLNRSEERNLEWSKYVADVNQQLLSEASLYGDILFVEVVDVYRNLPAKMLLFFKWLFENTDVDYVLKTDDDTFVDVLKVQEELELPNSWDWWSCFRIGWPVKRAGKWRQSFEYKEEIYPPFPTGAGYVLAKQALNWLKNRLDTLSVGYQGEDVAMGIWLEGMSPTRHAGDVCYWACSEPPATHPRSCNVMQLNVTGVYETWRTYREHGKLVE